MKVLVTTSVGWNLYFVNNTERWRCLNLLWLYVSSIDGVSLQKYAVFSKLLLGTSNFM